MNCDQKRRYIGPDSDGCAILSGDIVVFAGRDWRVLRDRESVECVETGHRLAWHTVGTSNVTLKSVALGAPLEASR